MRISQTCDVSTQSGICHSFGAAHRKRSEQGQPYITLHADQGGFEGVHVGNSSEPTTTN